MATRQKNRISIEGYVAWKKNRDGPRIYGVLCKIQTPGNFLSLITTITTTTTTSNNSINNNVNVKNFS